MEKTRIMIADNQELFRRSLGKLLPEAVSNIEIVGEASNGKELISHLKVRNADLVLIDLDMPIMDGTMTLEVIKARFRNTKVIMLTNNYGNANVAELMSLGANCFLSKNCGVQTLVNAINSVVNEGYYFDNALSFALLESVKEEKRGGGSSSDANLNQRERDIIKRICDGKTIKEIASDLHVSASTIDFYRTRIYSKTRCNKIASLIKFAIRNKIISVS